ncbi:uncharacterized protein LOC123296062 [Chrysoperla carnea]|uniref:uncharacterized protein LOC123296062 n=1 Tax=Chrysoperla carnea TaxID=189513 RepID=UPI001D082F93|nr:uncharacterized protein LOC123296062 [Chrysoperla carnea]
MTGERTYSCSNIEYFSKEEYSPDPNDSTMAIPYAVTRSTIFILAATLLLCGGYCSCLIGHFVRHRRLFTFISGVLFIVTGLIMLFGLIMYISVFKAEVGGKLRPRSQLVPAMFTYQYGYSFLLYVSGFITTELAGTSAIFLYIYSHQCEWRRKFIKDYLHPSGHHNTRGGHHHHLHHNHHHSTSGSSNRKYINRPIPAPSAASAFYHLDHVMMYHPACQRHPGAYINSNSAIQHFYPTQIPQRRYFFNKETTTNNSAGQSSQMTSPCSIHRTNSLKDLSYDLPPPPPPLPTISYQGFDSNDFLHLQSSPFTGPGGGGGNSGPGGDGNTTLLHHLKLQQHRTIPRDITTTIAAEITSDNEQFLLNNCDDYSPSIQHEFVTFDLDEPPPAPPPPQQRSEYSIDTLRRTTPV